MEDILTVRFRVGNVFRDKYISVYYDDERVAHMKKRVLAPGEMENVNIKKETLMKYPDLSKITIKVEEA